MNETESLYNQTVDERHVLTKANFLNRVIAKSIDFILVAVLYEVIPKIGFFAGLIYLIIADGLFEGRSIGKRLIGLKVVVKYADDRVLPCGYKESILRNTPFAMAYILFGIITAVPFIGWLISFVLIAVIVVFESLVMMGSDEGMRLGDEIAKTRVVEDRQGGFNVS